jgi:hypothetical protein
MNAPIKPSFRRGIDASAEASKRASFDKAHFFSLKDGERAILRFMTDYLDWVVVDVHQFVHTRPGPEGAKNWPKTMTAVCRRDPAFEGIYSDCYICDHMRQPEGKNKGKPYARTARTYALACEREEVVENGQLLGYRDKTREVQKTDKDGQPDGPAVIEKSIVIVQAAHSNFFGALEAMVRDAYHTAIDRDYVIFRRGSELDTKYSFAPLDPLDTVVKKADGTEEKVRLDLRDPRIAERYQSSIDLEEYVTNLASDEHYERFFDVRVPLVDSRSASSEGAPVEQQAKPSTDDPAVMQSIVDRVRGYNPDGQSQNPPQPAAAGVQDLG